MSFADIVRKLESYAIVWRCLRDPRFSRFSKTPTCDRQKNRQTYDYGVYSVYMVSRAQKKLAEQLSATIVRDISLYTDSH